MSMRSLTRIAALAWRDITAKRGLVQPVDREAHRRDRREGLLGVGQDELHHAGIMLDSIDV